MPSQRGRFRTQPTYRYTLASVDLRDGRVLALLAARLQAANESQLLQLLESLGEQLPLDALRGELGALFASLREKWPQFNVTIHSRPGGDPEHPELDVADGPWIATFAFAGCVFGSNDGRLASASTSPVWGSSTMPQAWVGRHSRTSSVSADSRKCWIVRSSVRRTSAPCVGFVADVLLAAYARRRPSR